MYSTDQSTLPLPNHTSTFTLTALLSTPQTHNFLTGSSNIKSTPSHGNSGALPLNVVSLLNFEEETNYLKVVQQYDFSGAGEVVTLDSVGSVLNGAIVTSKSTKFGDGDSMEKLYSVGLWVLGDVPVESESDFDNDGDDKYGDNDNYDEDRYSDTRKTNAKQLTTLTSTVSTSNQPDPLHQPTKLASLVPSQRTPIHSALPIVQPNASLSTPTTHYVFGDNSNVTLYDITNESVINTGITSECYKSNALAPNPHNPNIILTNSNTNLLLFDTRLKIDEVKPVWKMDNAHHYGVRSVDFNPNRPDFFASGGEDGVVRFWDLRSNSSSTMAEGGEDEGTKPAATSTSLASQAVKTLEGHNHWVTSIKYNRFHDQLLASSGTDACVNLWRVSSISSAPLLDVDNNLNSNDVDYNNTNTDNVDNNDDENDNETNDIRISRIDTNLEPVYAVAWSACDAWVYVSVGVDGNVFLNHVKSEEKYKILL